MLGIGIIGLGGFGLAQIETFRGIPGVRVVAVASRSASRAREVADRFGIPAWYSDADALCRDPRVSAVCVATEEDRHVEPCLAALAAGKHVLVEKPLATTSRDAMAIRDAAGTAAARVMPGHIVRFEARMVALQRQVAAGQLGRIAAIQASRNRSRATIASHGRTHLALVTAIHDIDACLWLIGERPERVRAWQTLDQGPNGVYGIWGTFTFPSGALATIESTWMQPDACGLAVGDRFTVTGTAGIASIDHGQSGIRLLTEGAMSVPEMGYEPAGHNGPGGALQAELMHFALLASGQDHAEVVTVDDGVNAVIAAEAMIESATRNEEIEITWPA